MISVRIMEQAAITTRILQRGRKREFGRSESGVVIDEQDTTAPRSGLCGEGGSVP